MKRNKKIITINLYEKPIEKMTSIERDEYFKSFSGLTYEEFEERYKDDTSDKLEKDLKAFIKKSNRP